MRLLRYFCLSIVPLFFLGGGVSALGEHPVISHVKTGETGLLTSEFIAIYNNSEEPINITDWCLSYSSASDLTKTNLVCVESNSSDIAVYIEPFSYARFSTNEFKSLLDGFIPDGTFSSGISGTSGHVRLLDENNIEVDKLGWGSTTNPEGQSVTAHSSGLLLVRKSIVDTSFLKDTDNNLDDFEALILETVPSSGLYEEVIVKDLCTNIDGLQTTIPDDYLVDESGDCQQDQCDNLAGLQIGVPEGYVSNDGENCEKIIIELESSILQITELLPNASSIDDGKEFVEIHNPNSWAVNIDGYRLELGPAYTKSHTFKSLLLEPLSYVSFSDLISGITLPNTSASLRLVAPAGNTVSETPAYENPKDDQTWAFINDTWQYTLSPTPNSANLPTVVVAEVEKTSSSDELADCGPGRYRNPETNRCRNIQTGDQELKPCEAGQVRNPETNRCRNNNSADGLVPCKPNQERNPETNRCRSIINTASALKPCAPGQERNPETNRCRKVASLGASTLSDVQDLPADSNSSSSWWIAGVVLAAAATYGIYEWRVEILRGLSRLKPKS